MSKRRRTSESQVPRTVLSQLSMESSVVPHRWAKKWESEDGNRVYIESEPRGKDYKDYMYTLRDLTNILHPKLSVSLKSYGNNWAGVHRHHLQGTTKATPVAPGIGIINTDNRRFCINDMQFPKQEGFADTVAWDAGTQGWFESIFLPGTFRISAGTSGITSTEDSVVGNQCSMSALIDRAKTVFSPLGPGDTTATVIGTVNKESDHAFHYNGGYQKHVFESMSETDIYYECWELTPRDLDYDWFYFDTQASFSKNIHELVEADYLRQRPDYNGIAYVPHSMEDGVHDGTQGTINQTGRQPLIKNDVGFRLNKNSESVFERFRVSKPKSGVIKPGGKLVYKLKQSGFKVMDSAWMRLATRRTQAQGPVTNLSLYDNARFPILVPRFTRFLVIRFYSALAVGKHTSGTYTGYQEATTNAGVTTIGKLDFQTVSTGPGRMIHTMDEVHSIRAVVASKQTHVIQRDYRALNFNETDQQMTDNWAAVNEEVDAFEEID